MRKITDRLSAGRLSATFTMARILVIDGCPAERRLAALLLAAASDWSVVEASSADHALTLSQLVPLDLVILDEQAAPPDRNLAEAIAREQPLLPILMITNESDDKHLEPAVEHAAAGCISRRQVPTGLAHEAERLLREPGVRPGRMSVAALPQQRSATFEMENDPASVAAVVGHVSGYCRRFGVMDEQDLYRVAVALEEALLNAIIHGNLQVSSALRERSDDAFRRLIERRRRDPEFGARRVRLACDVDEQGARIVIRDEGPGFDVSALPDPRDPQHVLRASGRGILLMRTFMDEVSFNAIGNEVTLVKRRHADGRSGASSTQQSCQA